MTPEELYDMLSVKFPTCYYDFSNIKESDRPKHPPYCAILEKSPVRIDADDKVYYKKPAYIVELYTSRNDYESEDILEDLFDDNDIIWGKEDKTLLQEEKKFLTVYKI